ncbi:MAG: carboxymuconolactone decarboxylase family protein [Nitrospira sp.]|nr:carboxymuconolactone decarboxylase family protein [Nitrospira sp.]
MSQSTAENEGPFAELRRLSPKVTGGLVRMRQEVYRDAPVPAKYKVLAAMAVSIAIRCEPCVQAYVRMACNEGVAQEEVIEFLEVAMVMQGCPGEEWALKAYGFYFIRSRGLILAKAMPRPVVPRTRFDRQTDLG